MQERETTHGLTRRETLKRGLLLGTGVVWATPAIQAIQMSRAYAQTVSQPGGQTDTPGTDVDSEVTRPTTPSTPDVTDPSTPGVTDNTPDVSPDVIAQVTPPGPPSLRPAVPDTVVAQQTLPETGIEVLTLAAVGSGLVGAGLISLKGALLLDSGKHEAGQASHSGTD